MLKLVPRKFKIEQDISEYHYFIEYFNGDWYIHLGNTDSLLTSNNTFNYIGFDTVSFATPDDALMYFNKYINEYAEAKKKSDKETVVSMLQLLEDIIVRNQ